MRMRFLLAGCPRLPPLALGAPGRPRHADDWPSLRGPQRDGICRETGLLQEWNSGEPKLAWKTKGLGEGFSGPAVVGNVLYTMGNLKGKEWVFALDVSKAGRRLWASPIGPIRHKGGGFPGPRSTPTIDGDRLYTLGINGDLVCMDIHNGDIVWRRNLVADFGGGTPNWGYAESVLIDGRRLLCTPGGAKATILALSKSDGKQVWASPIGDPAAYSSIIPFTAGKVKQYVTLTAKGIVGVRAKDGKFLLALQRPVQPGGQRRHLRHLPPDGLRRLRLRHRRRAGLDTKDRRRLQRQGNVFQQEDAEPSRRPHPPGRRPVWLQQSRRAHLPGLSDRRGEMDRPQLRQVLAALCRGPALLPGRARPDQPRGGHAGGLSAARPVQATRPQQP